jgi:hypothetical protein
MRWAGHVARMGRKDVYTEFWLEIMKERDHFLELWHRWGRNIKWKSMSGMVGDGLY